MTRLDEVMALITIAGMCAITVIVGGLYYPHTLAGAVSRFVFSLS